MLNKSFSSRPKYIIQAKERFFWQSAKNLAGEAGCQPCATCPNIANIAGSYKELYGVMWFVRQKQYLWT